MREGLVLRRDGRNVNRGGQERALSRRSVRQEKTDEKIRVGNVRIKRGNKQRKKNAKRKRKHKRKKSSEL